MIKKILVVDDEVDARKRITNFLNINHPELIIFEAEEGSEIIRFIEIEKPDLVFFDIQMSGFNAFQLLDQITPINFKIIFQTSYDQYAIAAFEKNACDYLLKPFSDDRLKRSLDKATMALNDLTKYNANISNGIKKLIKNKYLQCFVGKLSKTKYFIPVQEVEFIKSVDHVSVIYWNGKEYVYDLSLSELEKKLNPEIFMRIHRNNICRISSIRKILKQGNKSFVLLKNGEILSLSKHKKDEVENKILNG
jgi:DNA-binding LytR/AlgR family response regulator